MSTKENFEKHLERVQHTEAQAFAAAVLRFAGGSPCYSVTMDEIRKRTPLNPADIRDRDLFMFVAGIHAQLESIIEYMQEMIDERHENAEESKT